jgi:subtilisin-like proprotein convertase family protein
MQNSKHSLPRQILAILATWILIVTTFPLFPVPTALAFMPDNKTANDVEARGSSTHESITDDVIRKYDKKLFALGNKPLTDNMKKALEQIIAGNTGVDSVTGGTFVTSAAHFDGEDFAKSQKRLIDFKLKVKDLMMAQNPNVKDAREYLGQALHTLQDFYSHSNWVELQRGAYNSVLGVPGRPLTDPSIAAPCDDCVRNECPDCLNHLHSPGLITGYYSLRVSDPITDSFIFEKFEDRVKPSNLKCSHGGKVKLTIGIARDGSAKGDKSAGINKDTKNCVISPHDTKHVAAAKAAALATQKYLEDLQRLIKVNKMKVLLGGGPTLAMAIDTTGSMEDIILQVKQQAIQIVSSRIGTDEEPSNYVLVPFNDPSVGPVITTEDPFEFMQAISGLSADGGDDCPELSMTGMLQALNSMEDEGGELLMFTDASSKDGSLVGAVEGIALSRSISISPMAFGSCSPIDPGYIRLANNTGGQLFVLSGTEAGSITKLADFLNRSNAVDVLHVSGTLSGIAKTFDVPVDSTITRVTFSVSGTSTVTVTRPNNTVVQPTDPNVTNVPLSTGAVYSLTNMPTGTWRVTVNGTGDFSVRVVAESDLDFSFFDFLDGSGLSIHGRFTDIPGFPEANQAGTVVAQVSGSANTAQFAFRNPDGSALQSLSLTELGWANEDPAPSFTVGPVRQFLGQVTPPATPFRTYVTGVDVNGVPYQRVKSTVTKSQTVKITPPIPVNLTPGQSTTYVFKVTNSGATDTFSLTGSDDKGFLTSVSPATLTLTNGQTADVSVVLQPPASAGDKALDTLTLSAQSTGSSGAFNFARVKSVVLPTATLVFEQVVVTERNGNKNGVIEAGEGGSISARIVNTGTSSASGISVTVTSTTPGVLIETGSSTYPSIGPDLLAANTTPLTFSVNSSVVCGQEINLVLTATKSGSPPLVEEVTVPIGVATGQVSTTQTINYTGPAVAIPDANPSGVNIPIAVSGFTGSVADLDFKINGSSCTTTAGATTVGLDHTWVGDLVVTLTSPQGKTVSLIDRIGIGNNSGNNFCNTRLDDEATGLSVQDLVTADAPHTGTFKPATPLSSFDGENPNGTWVLNVSDRAGGDVGSVRAFSLIIGGSSCSVPPADNTAPTCELTASNAGPPPSIDVSVRDTGVGLAAINIVAANNVDVAVSPFAPGETEPVVVTGTLINPNSNGSFEIQSVDMVGNVSTCTRTINGSSTLTPIVVDNFNDNSLDTELWRTDVFLTGYGDFMVPVEETAQRLEVGPLRVNAADSYAGVGSTLSYIFTNGYVHVELVQAPSAQTNADAIFSAGNFVGYYQLRVSHGSLIGIKNILGNQTTLFTIPYDPVAHRFLRIRYDSATGNVVLDTAPGSGGVPGTWVQRYSEPWNSNVGFNGFQFEMKAGTLAAEPNAPGKVIWDNFEFGTSGP